MSQKIVCNLSPQSIKDAQKELNRYKRRLIKKCETFVRKMALLGVHTAYQHMPGTEGQGWRKYVFFDYNLETDKYGAKSVMYGTQTGLIRSEWRTLNNASGIEVADVSPLLMIEFGAGVKHDNNSRAHEFGMGAGTFPGQTHAFDEDGWWYMDLNYEWHHVDGIEPTMPMYYASLEMFTLLFRTAREVFGQP